MLVQLRRVVESTLALDGMIRIVIYLRKKKKKGKKSAICSIKMQNTEVMIAIKYLFLSIFCNEQFSIPSAFD
jgi:hypothetical protein